MSNHEFLMQSIAKFRELGNSGEVALDKMRWFCASEAANAFHQDLSLVDLLYAGFSPYKTYTVEDCLVEIFGMWSPISEEKVNKLDPENFLHDLEDRVKHVLEELENL